MNLIRAAKSSLAMSRLKFDGRVVLITGAGRGLGREYALAFAERGAKVVVNDLGGSTDGTGQKHSAAADDVVKEITSNGGSAVANYDSVEEGEKIVKTAIDHFGRVDVLVNNAGILRDASFQKMSDTDWSLVQKVHLSGAFKVTKAAWPHFKSQKYGRIIMTSSASGIYGNFGQANYGSAKLGLLGLANTLAIEGARSNIFCNTIAPIAASRMTKDAIPEEVFNVLQPKFVAPFVLHLCHENCQENGALFETGAGWASRLRWQQTFGTQFRKWGDELTPEIVSDHWDELSKWDNSRCGATAHDTIMGVTSSLQQVSSEVGNADSSAMETSGNSIVPSKAIGHVFAEEKFSYTAKDAILFALGIGVSVNKDSNAHLKYLYEGQEDFSVLPTFGVVFAQGPVFNGLSSGIPGVENVDLSQVLHGEQYLELLAPLPADGSMYTNAKVSDVLDKGKGALIIVDAETKDEDGRLLCKNQYSIFVNGAGGFGGRSKSDVAVPLGVTPNRQPDKIVETVTSLEQAAVYRLSGDLNPLHIDPEFANMAGFQVPILHGLCSYGFAVRCVIDSFANGDVKLFKSVKARFNRPVIPGQTLVIKMWREAKRVHFEVEIKETGDKAIVGGYIDLHSVEGPADPVSEDLKSAAIFEEIAAKLQEMPEMAKQINGVFVWNISEEGKEPGTWVMDFKSSPAKIYKGQYEGKSDVQLVVSDSDFVDMAAGQLNPQQAFFKGKLKITGNIMLTQKLGQIFNQKSKL